MMQSTLTLTGRCHYCNTPTPLRFCCRNHGDLYHYRKRNPEVKQVQDHSKRMHLCERRKQTPDQLAARIDAVVAEAKRKGTLGWATLATME